MLDLGCGKGGDLGKWNKVGTSRYVGLDLVEDHISEAGRRARKLSSTSMTVNFAVTDFTVRIRVILYDG